jgi:deoxyribose-phosphate aldolase
MTARELTSRADASVLNASALPADVHRVAADAIRLGARAVVAPPVWTARLATMLRGSGVRVVSLVGYPDGTSKSTIKAIEATSTIKDGADEIEVVPHFPALLRRDFDAARAELLEIARAARTTRRDVAISVVLKTDALRLEGDDAELERTLETACRAARESGCDGLTTMRAYPSSSGATVEVVRLLKRYGEGLLIKVAGVEDREHAEEVLAAGAGRIGTSSLTRLAGDNELEHQGR